MTMLLPRHKPENEIIGYKYLRPPWASGYSSCASKTSDRSLSQACIELEKFR